jgi:uncharacterized coiled-coil DUF342 family protein
MSKLEEAIKKHREAGGKLATIAKERNALPSQIAAAVEACDSQKLAELKQRQTVVEAEFVTANIADKKAAIEIMAAELSEATQRAGELTNALPAETDRLKKEREELNARLEQNAKDLQRLHWDETSSRQACQDLRVKIQSARDALDTYVRITKQKAIAA